MDLTELTVIFSVVYLLMRYTVACPLYHVPHIVAGKTVCCLPVFNCREGHEVKYCTEDGGKDLCQRCETGYVNWFNTSSIDTVKRSCFLLTKEHNYSCPIEDTYPTVESEPCEHMRCKCRTNMCRYGDPCEMCSRGVECGVNEEINAVTGECEPCEEMMYSPVGCAPCLYNETAWRISEEKRLNTTSDTQSTVPKTTPKDNQYTVTSKVPNNSTETLADNDGDGSGGGVIVPVLSALAGFVVLLAIFALIAFLYGKNRASHGDTSSVSAVVYNKLCSSSQSHYETETETTRTFPSPPMHGNVVPPQSEVVASKPAAAVSPMMNNSGQGTSDGACMDILKSGGDEQGSTTYVKLE